MEAERRRYRRVVCEAHASYSVINQVQRGVGEKSTTMNVSSGGIMFPVSYPIAPHSLLDIQLFLPPGSFFYTSAVTVRVIGEVKWSRRINGAERYNLGVQFKQISEEDRERIANYIYGRD
ncbi:MAG TPA: PilZ domain-containing protein [Syntrophaceae bacterium]|nr:PilZ domain-containing protein [Syntrophaceae bacterium]